MTLTQPQQRKVEQNLGLVGKVIKDKVHNPGQNSIYSYDDLYQIGCIGLCKAAYSDKGGCFSTYAYRLIWNEICTALIYANRRAAKECELIPEVLGKEDSLDEHHELSMILDRLEANASEAMAKGIPGDPSQRRRLFPRGNRQHTRGKRQMCRRPNLPHQEISQVASGPCGILIYAQLKTIQQTRPPQYKHCGGRVLPFWRKLWNSSRITAGYLSRSCPRSCCLSL